MPKDKSFSTAFHWGRVGLGYGSRTGGDASLVLIGSGSGAVGDEKLLPLVSLTMIGECRRWQQGAGSAAQMHGGLPVLFSALKRQLSGS